MTNSTGIVKRFYVAPELRGKGFAAKLLERLKSESKARGFSRIVLDVYYKNPRAARFYEKHGFTKYFQEPNEKWPESLTPEKFFYYQLSL